MDEWKLLKAQFRPLNDNFDKEVFVKFMSFPEASEISISDGIKTVYRHIHDENEKGYGMFVLFCSQDNITLEEIQELFIKGIHHSRQGNYDSSQIFSKIYCVLLYGDKSYYVTADNDYTPNKRDIDMIKYTGEPTLMCNLDRNYRTKQNK